MVLKVSRLIRDEGTVVVFSGISADDKIIEFAVDHRLAQDIIDAIEIDVEAYVQVEAWQILK